MRDTVTFKFRLDAKEMQRLIRALEADASRFGAKMEKVGNESKRTADKIRQSGDSAAAAAVKFQTATQGMLNLSTAGIQTFTSLSNLDRAANRLAQSKIGVARATDLMNNKELRLEELQRTGLGNTKKAAVLTNELATARADLAVKNDKVRIEEGALIDIQLLFVSNIANVMISSIQTIKTLRDMQALSTIRARIAETGLMVKMKELIIVQKASGGASAIANTGFKGMTIGIKGLTLSVKGLLMTLGPIAIGITAVSVAMQAWDEDWGDLRTNITKTLPFLDTANKDLDEAAGHLQDGRENLEGYNDALGEFGSKLGTLSTPHRNYLQMMAEAAEKLGNNRDLAKQYADQLVRIRTHGAGGGNFSSPSQGGQNFTPEKPQEKSFFDYDPFPMAYGEEQKSAIPAAVLNQKTSTVDPHIGGLGRRDKKISSSRINQIKFTGAQGGGWGGEGFQMNPHPFGTVQQIHAFNILSKKEKIKLTTELLRTTDSPEMIFATDNLLSELQLLPDTKIISPADAFKTEMTKEKDLNFFNTDNDKTPEDIIGNKSRFFFGNDLFKMKGFDQTHAGTKRGDIMNLTGTDIGNIANSISENDGIRLANMQKRMKSFQGKGGQSGKIAQYLAQQGGMSKGTTDVLSGFVGSTRDQAFNIALGNGSISATAAVQVKSVNWTGKKEWKAGLARRDSFVNGVGGMMMNVVNRLSGGRMFTSSGHSSVRKDRRWNGIQGAVIIQKAQQMGIREFPEWMDMIKEIPEVDMESPDNMKQAWSALRAAEAIASQYVSMRNAQMSSIGFGSSIKANANLIGFSGAGLYENIALLAATKRTNFNNTEVVEESKSKLSLTNSQIFSIRFNSTRGDRELQDRLRYVDQLEAMASGTSPL